MARVISECATACPMFLVGCACQWRTFFHTILPQYYHNYFNQDSFQQDFSRWPDEPFEEMDSTLAVQQYIQQQIRREPANIDVILTPPDAQDEGVWKYEHLR